LATCHFFLFPKKKIEVESTPFNTIEETQAESLRVLETLREKDFYKAFQKMEENVVLVSTCGRELLRG
jgi:hypothetical protein